jgi:aquaporin Z
VIRSAIAECAGTFSLVFFGCGCSVLAGGYFHSDVGLLFQAAVLGLSVTILIYLIRPVSGAHFNPAVTVGFAIANRFPVRDLIPYLVAQVVGAIGGAASLYFVVSGRQGVHLELSTFGANGYGMHSPGRYELHAALVVEALLTFAFVLVYLIVASARRARLAGPVVIGLAFALMSLMAIPVTNASMNPARSTGLAVVVGGWALDQLWLFWAAPLAGGVLAGLLHPVVVRKMSRAVRQGERVSIKSGPPCQSP